MKTREKRLLLFSLLCIFLVLLAVVLIYPRLEWKRSGKLYACRFSDDFSEFEENPSYNELYFYNEKHDVSLNHFQAKRFWFFYVLSFDYVEGDVRDTQFRLEEEYIKRWLEHAEIKENEKNINLAKLIENKTAVVGNKRYSGNEYDNSITYVLDGKWETLYVFESEGLTVIQVGFSDELPKYIAYRSRVSQGEK